MKFTTKDPTNTANKPLATGRDLVRISKFLTNFPNAPLFLAKQTSLQLSNPDVSYETNNFSGPRFYNPLGANTIAQVGVEAAEQHLY